MTSIALALTLERALIRALIWATRLCDQLILEVLIVVSPAVNGFSGDADGFGDLGIGFPGDDVGDGEHLLVFQGLLLGFLLGDIFAI